jgi:hypothetical protein
MKSLAIFALVFPVLLSHAQQVAMPAVTPAKEATQFDFLVGQWEIEVTPKVNGLAAMIHGAPRLTGTWKAWRAFDGFGIEDELRVVDGSGNPIALSHAQRVYDAKAKRWTLATLDVYRARFTQSSGQWQDGEMRTTGTGTTPEGKATLTRTRYYEITPERFRMRQDRSIDEGATWEEGVLAIAAKRVAAKAAR